MTVSLECLEKLGFTFVSSEAGISEYRLSCNGLKVVLLPNPDVQTVAVVQHVHVGSRHEGAGNTGYSHLLEHMLFKGTPTHNRAQGNSYDEFVHVNGSSMNATTSFDRTNYFAKIVPSALGDYLKLEADRLRNAILIDEDLTTEMPVVVDEFDRGENDPDQLLQKLMWATAFTEHPYKVDTIGSRSEVLRVTAQALKEKLYDIHYWPNNTTLIIVGGFTVDEALGHIAKHYGSIPPSPQPIPASYTEEPPQYGERRFVINKPGDLPRVGIAFHVPGAGHPDHHALAVLVAILGGSESSRLYRKLVDSGLTASTQSFMWETRDPGLLQVVSSLSEAAKPQQIERLILKEIDRLQRTLVSRKELARVKKLNCNGTLMTNTDTLKRALAISSGEACADWHWLAGFDSKYDQVTSGQVRDVARRYLTADNRTVGYFLPKQEAAPQAQAQTTVAKPASAGKAFSYAQQVQQHVLPNGLTLLLLPTQSESAIGLSLCLNAGNDRIAADNRILPGLVSRLMTTGSARYSKARLADFSSQMMTNFDFRCGTFKTELNTHVAPADLWQFLDMVADAVIAPSFDENELALAKTQYASYFKGAAIDPHSRANQALIQGLYLPSSPYYYADMPTREAQTKAITRDQLRAFHKQHVGPTGSVLVLVGKFDSDAVLKQVQQKFGHWQGGAALSKAEVAHSFAAPSAKRVNIDIPGKDNLTILVGLPSPFTLTAPDYAAATLANKALGGDTLTGKLGLEIREKRGLTYGVYSQFSDSTVGNGPWSVSMTTNAKKVEEAIPLISQVVNDYVASGLSQKELEAEKRSLLTAMTLSLESPLALAMYLAKYQYCGAGVAAFDTVLSSISKVTVDEVAQAIRTHFRLDNALTVVAGSLPTKQ